jgi:hypothetical protein
MPWCAVSGKADERGLFSISIKLEHLGETKRRTQMTQRRQMTQMKSSATTAPHAASPDLFWGRPADASARRRRNDSHQNSTGVL